MVGVTEVSSRPNDILNFGKVNCLTDNKVDHFAEFSTEAMWQVSDTHVGSTDRKHVTNFHLITLEYASLRNMTSEKSSLR